MVLRMPVMSEEEASAAVVVLEAVLRKAVLIEHDADKVRGVVEAIKTAPAQEGQKVSRDPTARQLGRFARKSDTSRKAALGNYPRSGTQRAKVLAFALAMPDEGVTRDMVSATLGMPPNVATPRILELIEGGWLEAKRDAEGRPVTRKTRSRADAEVLVPTARASARQRELAADDGPLVGSIGS